MVSAFPNSSRSSPGSAAALLESPLESLPNATESRPLSFTLRVSHPVTAADVFDSDFSRAGFSGLDIRQLAAAGYFQAIAYLLNQSLVPQNIYAQVSHSAVAGRLRILVEFERAPQPQRLIRFICDRIYTLNSDLIEGVHLIARTVGSAKTEWEERIRIPTISQRQVTAAPSSNRSTDLPSDLSSKTLADSLDGSSSSKTNSQGDHKLLHESARSKIARQIIRSQFKFFRAALLSGTATAAFLFGGLTDLILSERLSSSVAVQPEVTLPRWYEDSSPKATEVTHTTATPTARFTGRTVEAALETVSVVPHRAVAFPKDPTVTLLFGGELGLNDFIFEDAQSLNQLFSELGIYRRADVAMLGLSEPLATPSTSLQESFYHRTRPEALQALKAGGVDIVSLASEGTLTYGARGLEETLRTLDQGGLYRVGAGRNQQEAHRPEILEVKGQRIAYLGYNPEALKAAEQNSAGVASASSEERQHIVEDITALRPQVDWIVVNYRWGNALDNLSDSAQESSAFGVPAEWQRSLAYDAIDAGADMVVGYHPNQIQGAEIYKDRAIAYSLGDFVFNQAPFEDHDTVALRVSLRNQRMKVEFLPISIRDSQLEMATGEHGSAILQNVRRASQTFKQPMDFPVVLQARPTAPVLFDLPTQSPPAASPLPVEPFSGSFIEPAAEPVLLPDPLRHEAPNPMLHESDALFSTEADRPRAEID
ncbi:MAG: CapA family protein [Cyanobacteria bacterium P01_D01_bin.1]